jgi:hypothetical protein
LPNRQRQHRTLRIKKDVLPCAGRLYLRLVWGMLGGVSRILVTATQSHASDSQNDLRNNKTARNRNTSFLFDLHQEVTSLGFQLIPLNLIHVYNTSPNPGELHGKSWT